MTDHFFDAALGELSVVARGQPSLLVGDFNMEPTKIPCLAKGISAGPWVDFEAAWALATGMQPASTCKRAWSSGGGNRRAFMVGCPLAAAAVLSCKVQPDRCIAPHLAVRTLFDYDRWSGLVESLSRFGFLLSGLLDAGRFMHLVVLHGHQGADADPEQLALTEQLFDAALGELSIVARGEPCLVVGDFNVEPTKIPCLAKGISAGLWVDLEEAWALAAGPTPTCKKGWNASGGHRRDFMVGCPLTVAAVSSCKILSDRWVAPHLAVRTLFDCCRWTCSVTQVVQRTPLWPASWLPAIEKNRRSKSRGFGRFMMSVSNLCLVKMLCCWMRVWMSVMFLVRGLSGLVLLRLADAYRFCEGSFPSRGLVLGRGVARFKLVRLSGHKVRKVRGNTAYVHDAADIFLYRDSTSAPLLDMRRRFKLVINFLDSGQDLV